VWSRVQCRKWFVVEIVLVGKVLLDAGRTNDDDDDDNAAAT
jgi:hypothetical protein